MHAWDVVCLTHFCKSATVRYKSVSLTVSLHNGVFLSVWDEILLSFVSHPFLHLFNPLGFIIKGYEPLDLPF